MKVYIIYRKDGYGGSEVAEIFSSREIARKYVINEIFGNNETYRNKKEDILNSCADEHIYEYVVKSQYKNIDNTLDFWKIYNRLKMNVWDTGKHV